MVDVKICGLKTPEAVAAALSSGAKYLGFVSYPRSPRHVTALEIRALIKAVPPDIMTIAVVVDPDDALCDAIVDAGIKAFQLHGAEDARRVASIRARTGLPVIKAIAVSCARDITAGKAVMDASDMLLFDAKPPKSEASLPGGNGLRFDWTVLDTVALLKPWFLSGGLNAANVAEAVVKTGARKVDVSSGVETAPGVKDMGKIAAFVQAARNVKVV